MFNRGKNRPNLVESAVSPGFQSDRQTTLDQSVWVDGDVFGSTLTRTAGSNSTSTGSLLTDTKADLATFTDSQIISSNIKSASVSRSSLNECAVVGSTVRDVTLNSTLIEWSHITGWAGWDAAAEHSATPILPRLEDKTWWLESAEIRSQRDLMWSTEDAVGGALLIYRRHPYHGVEQWGLTTPLLHAPIIGETPQEVAATLTSRFVAKQITDRNRDMRTRLLLLVSDTVYYKGGGEITLPGERNEA